MKYLCLAYEQESRFDAMPREEWDALRRETMAYIEELGMRPLAAHCHAGLAAPARRTGERDWAQQHLTAALTVYRGLGMRFWLEWVQSEVPAPA